MKKYTIITIIVVGIILGFLTGVYLYKVNQIDYNKEEIIAKTIEDECTAIAELNNEEIYKLVEASSKQEKTSPNCVIRLKIYYEKCEHLIEKRKKIEEAEVNLTEKELKQKFSNWEIQKFTPNEIVLYKELNEFCDEHFLLIEEEGYIIIYKIDENNNMEFFKTTEITTDYLTQEDLEKIRSGIKIYTQEELNKTLEDFE